MDHYGRYGIYIARSWRHKIQWCGDGGGHGRQDRAYRFSVGKRTVDGNKRLGLQDVAKIRPGMAAEQSDGAFSKQAERHARHRPLQHGPEGRQREDDMDKQQRGCHIAIRKIQSYGTAGEYLRRLVGKTGDPGMVLGEELYRQRLFRGQRPSYSRLAERHGGILWLQR